jgi:two-component system, OmpR family, sensor histidine kinase CiaH
MFHSAALKLTTWYLALIMLVSICTSVALYHVSSIDLQRNNRRQVGFYNNFLGPDDISGLSSLRQKQLHEDQSHLKANLIIFNLFVLVAGGGASYLLARRTLEPIENALEAQSRFTADASHELRTPLTAIQTENEVALRNPDLSKKEALQLLKSNLEEVAKLKTLSDGLLHLASTDGKLPEGKLVSLAGIAAEAQKKWDKAASSKEIKITSHIKDATVQGDSASLADLVSILLDNAIKYTPAGGEVKLNSGIKDRYPFVQVADNGQGIKAVDLPHIFDRFFRADASRSKETSNGYGLGLAIAKKIADSHEATLEVRSTPGKGSTFTLQLPKV